MEIFHELEGNPQEQEGHKGRTQEKHSRTSPITHPLDSQTHEIHKVHEQSKGNKIHGRVHPNPMRREVLTIHKDSSPVGGLASTRDLLQGGGSLTLSRGEGRSKAHIQMSYHIR